MNWKVGIRNGDTDINERARQKRQMPEVLIITPESLHLFLAQKGYVETFRTLKIIAVDEWHELLGSKRGVQVELAISRIVGCSKLSTGERSPLSIWGISATIGNLEEARDVLLSCLSLATSIDSRNKYEYDTHINSDHSIIRAEMDKAIEIESILPDEIEKYPWAGHLGIKLAEKVLPVIQASKTTLIFIIQSGQK